MVMPRAAHEGALRREERSQARPLRVGEVPRGAGGRGHGCGGARPQPARHVTALGHGLMAAPPGRPAQAEACLAGSSRPPG